jgi:hypothetical protein
MIKLGTHTKWTKSTYSCGQNNCVEVRSTEATVVSVTDSKIPDTPERSVLTVSPAAFTAFVRSVRS